MDRVPLVHIPEGARAFVSGLDNPRGLGVRFFLAGDRVEGEWTVDETFQGWAGLAHGSMFAAIHDDAAGWAMVAIAARTGFTTRIDVRFLAPIRVGDRIVARARAGELKDRGGVFHSEIARGDGTLASTAVVEFAFLDRARVEKVLGRTLSAEMVRWFEADDETRRMLVRERGMASVSAAPESSMR